MARDYQPVEVRAVPWAQAFKVVQERGAKGIAVRDLARALEHEPDDPAVEKAVQQLVEQGRVRLYFGRDSTGRPGNVVQVYGERLGKRDEPEGD